MRTQNRKSLYEDALPSTASLSPSPNAPKVATARLDSSMIIAAVVLLSALFFISFVYMYIRRSASTNSFDISRRTRVHRRYSLGPTAQSDLAPSTVRSLALFAYDANAKEPVDCAVCLGGLEDKETVKMMPCCGHVFHQQCIDTWVSCHASCPLCRSTPSVKSRARSVL